MCRPLPFQSGGWLVSRAAASDGLLNFKPTTPPPGVSSMPSTSSNLLICERSGEITFFLSLCKLVYIDFVSLVDIIRTSLASFELNPYPGYPRVGYIQSSERTTVLTLSMISITLILIMIYIYI